MAVGTYTYDADDNVSYKTLSTNNGWRMHYIYDSRLRVQEVDHQLYSSGSWSTKYEYSYGRDNAGNITGYTRNQGGTSYPVTYQYDYADRLTSDASGSWTGWSGWSHSVSYTYDANGNRTSVTRNGNQSNVTCYKDPAGYITDQLQSGDGWSESSFDGDGNPQTVTGPSGSLGTITYNQEDEPEASYPSWGGAGTNLYQFDGDHKIVSKGSGSTGVTTYYVYDGSDIISEVASGNPTYRLPGVCEYNSQDSSPNVYQMDNGLGSTVGETADGSTSYLDSYDYDAYGVETDMGTQPTGTSHFRFRGKAGYVHDHDTEGLLSGSGLVLCGERFYVPGLGRFLNQDPIGQKGGLNMYGYCEDNPLDKIDPLGQDGYYNVVIAGDTSGAAFPMWPGYLLAASGLHADVENGPSKARAVSLLTEANIGILWGHGSWRGPYINYDQRLNLKDIEAIGRARAGAGLGKMDEIEVDQCFSLADPRMINAWLTVSKKVTGFLGETWDPDSKHPGVAYTFTAPVNPRTWKAQNLRWYK